MKGKFSITGALAAGIVASGLAVSTPAAAKEIILNMAGPDWGPTRFLQEYFNKTYKAKSGNDVKLVFDFIPWPNFYDRVAASLTSGEKKYQMIVSDSQWIGTFIEGGHFMKLNKYIDADPELQAIMKDIHPAMVQNYSTYPHKSKNYYGFPQFPDTKVTWFRTDLFCHDGERAAVKAKFNQTLPCSYEEWKDTDWTGGRTSASSSAATREPNWVTASPRKIFTVSPTRPAKSSTSPPCRSMPSSGSMAAASGTRPTSPMPRLKAS